MIQEKLISIKAGKVVDTRGTVYPRPLLYIKKAMDKMKSGEIIEIYTSSSDTKQDLPKWAKENGHEYMGAIENPGFFKIYLKKKQLIP